MKDLFDIRRNYSLKTLDESDVNADSMKFFEQWFNEALASKVLEPNAMSLATSTPDGKPSSRIVLLKQIKDEGFVFFTNYDSRKGRQLAENSYCALTFVWNELERQVRIEGRAEKITPEQSDLYFEVRPEKSKLGAWASPQSSVVHDRHYLEQLVTDYKMTFAGKKITRPANWGGYLVKPFLIEFWQGRENRLHDRIQYTRGGDVWRIERLAP